MKNDRFPRDISQYIDLKSPILKYLIEIEKKFWKSDTNQNFRMPLAAKLENEEDSERSIQSLKGITSYQLANQNSPVRQASHLKAVFGKRSEKDKLTLNEILNRETAAGFKSQPRSQRLDGNFHVIDAKEIAKKRQKQFDLIEEDLVHINKPKVQPQRPQQAQLHSFKTLKNLRNGNSGDFKEENNSSITWTAIKEPKDIQFAVQPNGVHSLKTQTFFNSQAIGAKAKIETTTRSPRNIVEKVLQAPSASNRIRIATNLQSTSILKQTGIIGPSSPRDKALSKVGHSGFQSTRNQNTSKFDTSFGSKGDFKATYQSTKKLVTMGSQNNLSHHSNYQVAGTKVRPEAKPEKLKVNLTEQSLSTLGSRASKGPVQLVSIRDKNLMVLKKQATTTSTKTKSPESSHLISSQLFNNIRSKLAR
jgi:hypothetical protein